MKINAVDPADERNRFSVNLELAGQCALILGIVFCVDDLPTLSYELALTLGKHTQALAALFELQAHGRPAQLGTIQPSRHTVQSFDKEVEDIVAFVTMPWTVAAEAAE